MSKRVGKRNAESSQLDKGFNAEKIREQSEAIRKARKNRRDQWRCNECKHFLRLAHEHLGDPIFQQAISVIDSYGLGDVGAARRLEKIGGLISDRDALLPELVEQKLAEYKLSGDQASLRRACETVAMAHVAEATSLEGASKRVERVYRATRKGEIPSGHTGAWIKVGQLCFNERSKTFEVVNLQRVPYDRAWRKALAEGRFFRLPQSWDICKPVDHDKILPKIE